MANLRGLNIDGSRFVLKLDADDCIYNAFYKFLIICLFLEYDERLSEADKLAKSDLEKLSNEILERINSSIVYDSETNSVTLKYNSTTVFEFQGDKLINKDYVSQKSKELIQIISDKCNLLPNQIKFPTFRSQFILSLNKLGQDKSKIIKQILFVTNQPVFNLVLQLSKFYNFSSYELISGSLRQTAQLDKLNSEYHGTGLFKEDIKLICELLNEQLQLTFVLSSVDCHSLYSQKPDHSKFILYQATSEYYASLGKTFILTLDDLESLLQELNFLYLNQPYFLHQHIQYVFQPYNGIMLEQNNSQNKLRIVEGTREHILPHHTQRQTLSNLLAAYFHIKELNLLKQMDQRMLNEFAAAISKQITSSSAGETPATTQPSVDSSLQSAANSSVQISSTLFNASSIHSLEVGPSKDLSYGSNQSS